LAQDFRQILDRMVAIGQKPKQPQPRALARSFEDSDKFSQLSHSLSNRYKDVFISIEGKGPEGERRSYAVIATWMSAPLRLRKAWARQRSKIPAASSAPRAS